MAVYTQITEQDAKELLEKFDIGELGSLTPIIEGVENSNYLLATSQNKYILTIFEKRTPREDLPYFMAFKEHLAAKNINCPQPIASKDGTIIHDLHNKAASIVSFLVGAPTNIITPEHCYSLGVAVAKVHLAALDFSQTRENGIGIKQWRGLYSKFKSRIDEIESGIGVYIDSELAYLEPAWQHDLPKANVHADLFPDNVFFEGVKVCGIIDFYFSCYELLIYDLAICANAWCFENDIFVKERYDALISGYENIRKLSGAEHSALPICLRGAALRFFLSRAYDMIFHPKGSFVTPKNPIEYLNKLRYFKNN